MLELPTFRVIARVNPIEVSLGVSCEAVESKGDSEVAEFCSLAELS